MSGYDYTTRYTRDEKKKALSQIVLEAWTEQTTEAREAKRGALDHPFEVRAFRTDKIDRLVEVLKKTEALELLAEMIGVILEAED